MNDENKPFTDEEISNELFSYKNNYKERAEVSVNFRTMKALESIAESLKLPATTPVVGEALTVDGLEGRNVNIVDCSNVTVHA